MLNLKKRALNVTLDAPQSVSDTQQLRVTVKSDTPSRVFLWAVDDGIC